MEIIKTAIPLGVETPFQVLHLSDTHLTRADLRDRERKVKLAKNRLPIFPEAEDVLQSACAAAKQLQVPIVHTGDLIDFVSMANLEAAKKFTDENDCFMAAGNHEFSLYVGEAKEDAAYRNQSLAAVQAAFKNDIRMSSRIIGGVNFVALDNGYYLFEEKQFEFLKQEVEKGLPMILLMHTPLYEHALYEKMMKQSPCAYLAGVPTELMKSYPTDRFQQQLADEITLKVMEYIKDQPLIKALITGHLHFNYEGVYADRIPQIVTSCTDARLIEIV
ncbi:MAG: metallophosphoesterase [Firmicutes bacterium]|nr:metallophosphoesterase [Bacillota bacterium]